MSYSQRANTAVNAKMNVIHLRQLYRSLYSPGLHPAYCRNTREKWLGDEKPRYKAIAADDFPE